MSASPLATPSAGGDVPPLDSAATSPAGADFLAPPQSAPPPPSGAHAPAHITHAQASAPTRSATSPLAVRENSGPIQLPRRRRTHPAAARSDDLPAVQRVMSDLFTPEHPVGPAPTVWQSIRAFFLSSWV